jgi:hypothetical protein
MARLAHGLRGERVRMHARASRIALVTVMTLLCLSCGKPGAEYLGKWQNVKNKNDQLEIVRNGDNFLVTKAAKRRPR